MNWAYYTGKFLTRMLLFLLAHWRVRGRENMPEQGPLLIVANHINLADPPILAVSIRRKAMFMAKEELFRSRFSRFFMRNFGAFPVRRGQLDRGALRRAEQLLAQGSALIMFPEGQRSKNAQLQPAFAGSALVAVRSDVPILPVGISGTEKIKGRAWLFRRPRVTINIGHPFYLPAVNGKLTRAELAQLTNFMMEHIAELLPPEYRENYAGKESREYEN